MDFPGSFELKSRLFKGPQRTKVIGAYVSVKFFDRHGAESVAGSGLQENCSVTPVPSGLFNQNMDLSATAPKAVQTHLPDRFVFMNDSDQYL